MNLFRRHFAALLPIAILLTAAACTGSPDPEPSLPPVSTETTSTTTPTTTAPKYGKNPLTGIEDMQTDNNRPIGFVVTDESSTLTQLYLETADLYFEAETEAGIPRILAIYSSIDRIPERIGPVRSARPHFVKIAQALDCIYCHIGGSSTGLDTIRALGVDDLANAYETDPVLKQSKNFSWNRSAFTREKVLAAVSRNRYRLTGEQNRSPYQFGSKTGTSPATTVNVKLSEAYNMAFTYDAASGLYQKHRNALSTPVHTTATGGTITASNIIVMFDRRTVDEMYTDSKGHQTPRYDFDLKSGSGLLASGGTSRPIHWERSAGGLQFWEEDGTTPLTVATGKTFICLASDTLKSRTSIT